MDRILLATDFSTRSDRALRRASLIARKVGARLTLVHVVDNEQPEQLVHSNEAEAASVLADLVSTISGVDEVEADWLISVDDAHSGIIAAADSISADLIVVGRHRSRMSDVFIGTIAERLVQQSSRPLLIAVDTPAANHRSTLLALDLDEASKRVARRALAMGIFDHTNVTVMHAFDAPAEGMMWRSLESAETVEDYVANEGIAAAEKLRELLQELDLPPTAQTVASRNGTPARTIQESARQCGSDLIVMGASQRKGIERALVGSVTGDVIRDSHLDVLIIPDREPA